MAKTRLKSFWIGKLIKVCPGGRHGWYETNLGFPVRKEIGKVAGFSNPRKGKDPGLRNLDDPAFRAAYEQVSHVLSIFFSDPFFVPKAEDFQEFNLTRDPRKTRILRLDAMVNWRMKVYRACRCSLPNHVTCTQNAFWAGKHVSMRFLCGRIYECERTYHRRYLSKGECWAWWEHWWAGREAPDLMRATQKILRNMERSAVLLE